MTASRQVSDNDIRTSIVITGDGNTATLTLGDTNVTLRLDRKQARPNPDPAPQSADISDLRLLEADSASVPLMGRESVMRDLRAWLDSPAPVALRCLIGPAGAGKTRTAIELCRAVDPDKGAAGTWATGFLSPKDVARLVDATATRSLTWDRPTLLVIDYAATGSAALAEWLDILSRSPRTGHLRLLLLEREAPTGFGWWHSLATGGSSQRRKLIDGDPRPLPGLADPDTRRSLLNAALFAARAQAGDPPDLPPVPAAGADADFDRRLAADQFASPLALMMAGVLARALGPTRALGLRHLEAARHLATRELNRYDRLAQAAPVSPAALRHLLACNGLAGGLSIAALRDTLAAELALGHHAATDTPALADLLQQELPPRDALRPWLATPQPDLIGEALILQALGGAPDTQAAAAALVARAFAHAPDRAAPALMRLAQDYAYAAEDLTATPVDRATARAILGWLGALADGLPEPDLARLVDALPHQTTVLRDLAADWTARLSQAATSRLRRPGAWAYLPRRLGALGRLPGLRHIARVLAPRLAPDDLAAMATAAGHANNLAVRLSEQGRREEALVQAREALDLRRALAAARPDAFTPDLAMSLHTLANRLRDLGQREAALAAAREAVDLYRALAAARPDAFTPNLATSLNNLANRLSDLGQAEAALAAAREAVDLRRALAAARPDAFTPNLASSLNTLANRLSDLGQREAALVAAREAVDLYRALAAARPDAFTPNLAASLHNLANCLSDLGQREAALAAAREAVDLYRTLAATRPDAFTPNLATSVIVLSDIAWALGDQAAGFAHSVEAIRLLAPHFHARPQAHAGLMATMCNDYRDRCQALSRDPDPALLGPILARL